MHALACNPKASGDLARPNALAPEVPDAIRGQAVSNAVFSQVMPAAEPHDIHGVLISTAVMCVGHLPRPTGIARRAITDLAGTRHKLA